METTKAVIKDGKTLFEGTDNECWVYILNHQGQSVSWELRYEGYSIVEKESK